ncbi:MAG: regulatory protein RecX, partial [Moraxellaceae bacterium]|nr:regulatory protein RecX [Moraxellaceae bacterium]
MSWKKRASKYSSDVYGAEDSGPVWSADQLWSKVLAWQTRREHSRRELEQKLKRINAQPDQIEAVLAKLIDYNLQSDQRFAEGMVRSQINRGRAARVIKQRLQVAGVSADEPEIVTQLGQVDWVTEATNQLRKRFGQVLSTDRKEKARYIRFLQYRGYSMSHAIAAISRLGL